VVSWNHDTTFNGVVPLLLRKSIIGQGQPLKHLQA
jgi:hypothetical protein